jgi:hypothetical protein
MSGCARAKVAVEALQNAMIEAEAATMYETAPLPMEAASASVGGDHVNETDHADSVARGWPTELFVDAALMRFFLCRLCRRVLRDPVALACGHVYCRGCITAHADRGLPLPLDAVRTKYGARARAQMQTHHAAAADKTSAASIATDLAAAAADASDAVGDAAGAECPTLRRVSTMEAAAQTYSSSSSEDAPTPAVTITSAQASSSSGMTTTNINMASESAATHASSSQSEAEALPSASVEAASEAETNIMPSESDSSAQHAADLVAPSTESAIVIDSDSASSSECDDPSSTQPPPAGFLFCPADRTAIEIATLGASHSAFHARRVADLRVRCRFHARGCPATALPLSTLDAHCGACAWRDVRCLACGRVGRCLAMAAHLHAECARAKVLAAHGDPLAEPDSDDSMSDEQGALESESDSGLVGVSANDKDSACDGDSVGSPRPSERNASSSADGGVIASPIIANSSSLSPRAAAQQSHA